MLSQARQDAIASRLAAWEGPEVEERPDPASRAGFLVTARGRVKPGDLDADGRLSPCAIVHRFTDGTVQTGAAIGMDSEFLVTHRRGMSTFELVLRLSARCRSTSRISSKPASRISAIRRCAWCTS